MLKKRSLFLIASICLFLLSCSETPPEPTPDPADTTSVAIESPPVQKLSEAEEYMQYNVNDTTPSISTGSVQKGRLKNGKLMPLSGNNFSYFDERSYVAGRAFVNGKVLKTVLATYADLEKEQPDRKFTIMECSNRNGGKLHPHRTHQNGLSIDFMMPMHLNGKPDYSLDTIGAAHYFLTYENDGKLEGKDLQIDFELVAKHLLLLEKNAQKNGLHISKVIIKTEFKKHLFNTPSGRKLKNSDIYVVKSLTPLINGLHDDHYHIDFEILKK